MSTEIDELKQARYRSDKTISGHNAFLRPPTGETNSVDTRGFNFVLQEPHPIFFVSAKALVDFRQRKRSIVDFGAPAIGLKMNFLLMLLSSAGSAEGNYR